MEEVGLSEVGRRLLLEVRATDARGDPASVTQVVTPTTSSSSRPPRAKTLTERKTSDIFDFAAAAAAAKAAAAAGFGSQNKFFQRSFLLLPTQNDD